VSDALPRRGRSVLEEGVLCYLAVRTPFGPHVTPLVYVADRGAVWITTSRRSVKARAWRGDPSVAGLVRGSGGTVTFRGSVRTYDVLDPSTWPAAARSGPRILRAATRFTLKNARFFTGYAIDARQVPFAWTPPGRVFAEIRPDSGWILRSDGRPEEGWGQWSLPAGRTRRYRASFPPGGRGAEGERRTPATVREAVGGSGDGVLAVEVDGRLTVLPVRWRWVAGRDAVDAVLPADAHELAGPGSGFPAALVVDRASQWRASEMRGILMQGTARAFSPSLTRRGRPALLDRMARVGGGYGLDDLAMVRLEPSRTVWWAGWTSGTVVQPLGRRADR
jgi:hypothetical protein